MHNHSLYPGCRTLLLVLALGVGLGCLAPLGAAGTPARPPAAGTALVIIERDVPQTRNFVPVINHEAMAINVSSHPVVLDIWAPIPDGLYVKDKFYPAFGQESLLAAPMESPFSLRVKAYEILDRPQAVRRAGGTEFVWRKVQIQPNDAAIAQYDNYFGPRGQFTTKKGLRLLELDVGCDYRASVKAGVVTLTLSYVLKNIGAKPWRYISFGVFLPDTVIGVGEDLAVLASVRATASAGVDVERSTISDGRGRMAQGSDFCLNVEELPPGKEARCTLKVTGAPHSPGEIYPLFTVQARGEGKRIWPATRIQSAVKLKTEGFYYRHLNLVLPDPRYFKLETGGRISVERS